jgi:Zn-dependent peptidase ImmA (M78 family)
MVTRFSALLSFPEAFFYRTDIDKLPEGAATFRSRSRTPAKEKHAALAAGAMAQELARWILERFEIPSVNIPELHDVQNPELVAEIARTELNLGDRPVPNMIRLLESRGVLVFSLAQDCSEIDAFSFWSHGRPIVLLNTMKSAERSRLDAAHELAHLVLHRNEETTKVEEHEANHFAGAFLMPRQDLHSRFRRINSLTQLIQTKGTLGVSLAALVYRLHQVGILTDWQHRTFAIELSKRGYRKSEPSPMRRETSVLLPKVFEYLKERGVRIRHVAEELSWNQEHLSDLVFGLGATLLSVNGGGQRKSTTLKPKLRSI